MTNPRSLKCKHVFCSVCLRSALDVSNKCPVCQEPQGALQGNQPRGEMTFRVDRYSVPGYEGNFEAVVVEKTGGNFCWWFPFDFVESQSHSNLTQTASSL